MGNKTGVIVYNLVVLKHIVVTSVIVMTFLGLVWRMKIYFVNGMKYWCLSKQ